ncbi:MAG: site-2 protease family protein [Candidatus Omnitrophica bacterium]|nr:site-2 protease family protein [Candidatus Omnitrophota bacterium]
MEFLIHFLVLLPLFMAAVIIHEVSHGWVALSLGDPTARLSGRLTLNPLKHIDPVGTVFLPLFLLLLNAPFVFGWAKPVPVNALLLRHPKRDMLWVGLSGPAANFLLAAFTAALLRLGAGFIPPLGAGLGKALVLINLVLGTFNLLPIPPLDGSRVLTGLLPVSLAKGVLALERWGIALVFLLLYFGVMQRIVWPVVLSLARWLGVG